jgi:agmatinase
MDFFLDKNLILENSCSLEDAKFALVGVPFDSTSSYRPGSRFGPLWIRKELLELGKPASFFESGLYDLGNVNVIHGNCRATLNNVREVTDGLVRHDVIPISLGGEHSISYPAIKSLKEKFKELQVIHFDAHPDLMDDYLGEKWSHATVMRRCLELGVNLVQRGIRVYEEGEEDSKEFQKAQPKKGVPTYISIDIDVLDPLIVPGTGTPEPGGWSFDKLQNELNELCKAQNIVGFDIVEVNPLVDSSDITSITAAKLLVGLLSSI